MEQDAVLVVISMVGYLLGRGGVVKVEHGKTLSGLLVYVFSPCVSFSTFSSQFTKEYLSQKYLLMLVSLGILLLLMLVCHFAAQRMRGTDYERKVFEYSMIIPNFGYMGTALVGSLYGDAVLLDCTLFALPLNVYCYTIGYNLLTGNTGGKFSLKRIFTPPMIGMLAGCVVGLLKLPIPDFLSTAVSKGASCMGPISMLLTGITVSQFRMKALIVNIRAYIVTAVRLVVVPVVLALLLRVVGFGFAVTAAVCIFAMPCGLNTIVYPQLVGEDCKNGASLALLSTAFSLITIPLCLNFLL